MNEKHFNYLLNSNHNPQGPVGQNGLDFGKRVQCLEPLPEILNQQFDRKNLQCLCANQNNSNLTVTLAILAWGRMMPENAIKLFKKWDNLDKIVTKIRTGKIENRRKAFEIFQIARNKGNLPGLGIAYFTKLICFLNPKLNGYILDQWTGKSINLLWCGSPLVNISESVWVNDKNNSQTYELFCKRVEELAQALPCEPLIAEERIFSVGGENPGNWRRYLKENYLQPVNLRKRVFNYEHWISSGFKIKEPKIFQRELLKLFYGNKEAYSYYRHWLYTLILSDNEQNELKEFNKILDIKKGTENYDSLIKHYLENNSSEIFFQKGINTFEISIKNSNTTLNHSHCFLYQQYYEIEVLFLVLASFIKLNEDNLLDTSLENFKDKKGNLRKGVIIDFLKSKLIKNPSVSNLFELAYNPKVRNIIGHNDYRIDGDQIVSLDDGFTIHKTEFFTALRSIEKLNNYLLNYLSNKNINSDNFNNEGILGIAFGIENKLPVLNVFQLSCFYEFGEINWPNKITFNIKGNLLETDFGDRVPTKGKITKGLRDDWFQPLKETEFLKVFLTPIIPRNLETEFITLDVGDFVVLEEEKSYKIKYEINENKP